MCGRGGEEGGYRAGRGEGGDEVCGRGRGEDGLVVLGDL